MELCARFYVIRETIMHLLADICSHGCQQTFRYTSVFKAHIRRKHNQSENVMDDDHNGHDDGDDANANANEDLLDEIPVPHINPGYHYVMNKDEVTKLAASTVAILKSSSSVVQSTVDNVVSETTSLFSDVISSLKHQTATLLQRRGILEDDDSKSLLRSFDDFEFPFEKLGSAYQQQKYFVESGYFIKPDEIPYAVSYLPRHNPNTGHVDQNAKHSTFQYVPLKKLMKCILESKGVMCTILQHRASNDGIMRDFHDGQFSRHHYVFSDPRNIALQLYVDE